MKIAIAITTKDKVELTRRSIEPLLHGSFDLFWIDGSATDEGKELPYKYGIPPSGFLFSNIGGGADPAIVAAFTKLLEHPNQYDVIGLVESDVLLHKDWYGPTIALFERGESEGLKVGAVSARAYSDRILIQRDGHAVMHNLGAGMILLTREAAHLALQWCRTGFTTENVLLFSQLAGLDLRRWWAFRGAEHMITLDWHLDACLAAHGLASLALTPSPVEMIGQDPPLTEQGLQIANGRYELLRNKMAFETYLTRQEMIRRGEFKPTFSQVHHDSQGYLYFPHQLELLGAFEEGEWRLKWSQGFGPFSWRSATSEDASIEHCWTIPVLGPCSVIVSGGDSGGKVHVEDEQSGYEIELDLMPEAQNGAYQLAIPGSVAYRNIRVTARLPGVVFYGLRTQIEQPSQPVEFDWNKLPPV